MEARAKMALPGRRAVRENLGALAIREQRVLLAIEARLQQSKDPLALPGLGRRSRGLLALQVQQEGPGRRVRPGRLAALVRQDLLGGQEAQVRQETLGRREALVRRDRQAPRDETRR